MRHEREQTFDFEAHGPGELTEILGALERVYTRLDNYKFDQQVEPTETCDGFKKISASQEIGRLAVVELMNGVAVMYTTAGRQAHYSHRFIFPDVDRDARYYKQAINLNVPIVPSPAYIDLPSVEAIASDNQARQQLLNVAETLELEDFGVQQQHDRLPVVFAENCGFYGLRA